MNAAAIDDHDDVFPGMTKDAHHLMNVLAEFVCIKMGHDFIEHARGPVLHCANDIKQDAAGDATPGPILRPDLEFAGLFSFDLAGPQGVWGNLHRDPATDSTGFLLRGP